MGDSVKPKIVCVGPRESWGLDDWKFYATLQEELHKEANKALRESLETSQSLIDISRDLIRQLEQSRRTQAGLNIFPAFRIKRARGRPKKAPISAHYGLLSGYEPPTNVRVVSKRGRKRKYHEDISIWNKKVIQARLTQRLSVRAALGLLLREAEGNLDEEKLNYLTKRISDYQKALKDSEDTILRKFQDIETVMYEGMAMRRVHKGSRY